MRTRWTKEEMESVLIQLNKQSYPFKKYRFSCDDKGLILLGSGGYANVYEMRSVKDPEKKFAVKVLGFGDKHIDLDEFRQLVEIQKNLSLLQENVVKIIAHIELRLKIDSDVNVLHVKKVSEYEEKRFTGDFLELQFVLMEKLIPVLKTDKAGRPVLFPEELADYKEDEIMKFAHDIGAALTEAHKKQLLHRDIKLENIFYDSKRKKYKLGDFGIAKMTDDGMASTVVFTKGYCAPEVVRALDEKYDNTADIYSFGIMLYLLLNELKFPDSENYNVNVSLQYSKGYVFPCPEHSENKLCDILGGMCAYDPDERYQSMDKVLNAIDGLLISDEIRFKKENQKATYVLAMIFYLAGMAMWKLTHFSNLSLDIGIGGYLFLLAGVYGCWLDIKKKEHIFLRVIMMGLGIYLLISTGFTWLKAIFIYIIFSSTGGFLGIVVSGIVIFDVLSEIMNRYPSIYVSMLDYKWASILLLSFSLVLFFQYIILCEGDMKIYGVYFKKNEYWKMVLLIYAMLLINGALYRSLNVQNVFDLRLFDICIGFANEYDPFWIGLGGVVLSASWIFRENVLKKIEN